MKHFASRRFWALYDDLPQDVRDLADAKFVLLKGDTGHPSLHFKQIGDVWSVRVGLHWRALGHDVPDGIQWFWIGSHADYDKIIGR